MEYKVLTLWQPWATLLVHGIKKIETRPKPTNWTAEKGTYLIHSASKWGREQEQICLQEPFISELEKLGYAFYNKVRLPLGQIIGSIEITECKQMVIGNIDDCLDILKLYQLNKNEVKFGNYEIGRYAWLTQNPRILETPIPYNGGQGYYQNFNKDINQLKFI